MELWIANVPWGSRLRFDILNKLQIQQTGRGGVLMQFFSPFPFPARRYGTMEKWARPKLRVCFYDVTAWFGGHKGIDPVSLKLKNLREWLIISIWNHLCHNFDYMWQTSWHACRSTHVSKQTSYSVSSMLTFSLRSTSSVWQMRVRYG